MIVFVRKSISAFFSLDQKVERFLFYMLTPLWVLSFYFLLLSRFLPGGVNQVFTSKSAKLLLFVITQVFFCNFVQYPSEAG